MQRSGSIRAADAACTARVRGRDARTLTQETRRVTMELRDRVALHIIVGVPYEHAHFRVVERKYIIDKVTKTNDHKIHIEPAQFSEPSRVRDRVNV